MAMSSIRWSEEDGQVRLGLPNDLDLSMAQPLLDSLRAAIKSASPVVVQAESVERVSTACVQALIAAARDTADHGGSFAILAPSDALTEACEDLGLASWLKQWSQV